MTYRLGRKSLQNLEGVHPNIVAAVKIAIGITPVDFSVHSGLRTAQEQKALFNRGASQRDGYRRKSEHQIQADGYGHAVDLVPYVDGKLRWEWPLIYPIAHAMDLAAEEVGVKLRWGGVWDRTMEDYGGNALAMQAAVRAYTVRHPGPDFIDGPHYEIA